MRNVCRVKYQWLDTGTIKKKKKKEKEKRNLKIKNKKKERKCDYFTV